ncbi:MAG: acyltransferase [Chryseobacterium sp.]|uniref:acyltransferase family protein n=1 Tax=Chryseobacterium sp. TaxID=1871047 RepID=UPI0025BD1BB8|nr:acyltransferase [Chryseobacterium sp.]MCJ7932525.1 acyltransferase [Chryseobacterium sp.]
MTEHSQRLYGLDHLRSLAIILVLLYHYRAFQHPGWVDSVGRFGWTGVDLFFVLSGFLISGQLFRELENTQTIHWKTFYIKRFFRIIPPYAFTLFLYFTFPFFREREALPQVWKLITFTQNFGLDVIDQGTFSHAWSLCIEEQFYLILPLFLLFLHQRNRFKYLVILIVLFIAFSLVFRFMMWNEFLKTSNRDSLEFWRVWYMKIYYPTYTRLDGLGIGVLIGYLMQFSSVFQQKVHRYGNPLFFAGTLLLGLSFWICNEQASEGASIFGFTGVAVSYGFMVMSAVSSSSFLFRSGSFITAQLAALSYAIYLSHKGIIHMVQHTLDYLGIQTADTISLFICLLACIAGALLYRFVIEQPFAQLKKRVLSSKV